MKSYSNTKKVRFVHECEPKKSSAPISGSRASHVQRGVQFRFFSPFSIPFYLVAYTYIMGKGKKKSKTSTDSKARIKEQSTLLLIESVHKSNVYLCVHLICIEV